ncbi:MAG: Pr6Pr family membrane protein [Candidatus Saccharimonas sp.]
MITRRTALIAYKVFFALLGFSALVTEMVALIERQSLNLLNFFSYFTVQTNIVVFVTLLLSALFLAAGKERRLDGLRSATTVYILVVGIGFSLLLSTVQGLVLTAVPWDNTVLHYLIPMAVLVDFLIDRPRRTVSFRTALLWLLFPFTYAIYAFTRGALTGWYPYPFLNPSTNGVGAVIVTVIGLLVLGVALVAIVVRLSTSDRRKKA